MAERQAPTYIDQTVGEVLIKSTWQHHKSVESANTQTPPDERMEQETQTKQSCLRFSEQASKGAGTEEVFHPQAISDGLKYLYTTPYDEGHMANFLSSIEEEMVNLLTQSGKSSAYLGYEPNWTERTQDVSLHLTLVPPFTKEGEWNVTGLSWNATGTTVAVAYDRIDQVAWCRTKGRVCVWNISRQDLNPTVPHWSLESDSLVSTVAFHPSNPALLAGGTYNGELLVWNLADASHPPMSSLSCRTVNSREPISSLVWLQDFAETSGSNRFVLCSSSQDGKVLFWSLAKRLEVPLAAYEVHNKKHDLVGILSMSFMRTVAGMGRNTDPGLKSMMVIGTESGDILRTKPGLSIGETECDLSKGLPALEVDSFDPHFGPVQSVDCSPYIRNVFLSCSSDGTVRLYSALERSFLLALEPSMETKHYLYDAKFSPYRPAVLATASRSGHLHLYDFEISRTKPILSVEAGVDGAPVLALAFNQRDRHFVATGDQRGTTKVWRLSTRLYSMSDLERAALRSVEVKSKERRAAEAEARDGGNQVNVFRLLFGFQI